MSETAQATSISEQVRSLVQSGEVQLPPLPELAVRLQQLLADEDHVDAACVAELVHSDAAIASALLRIANSVTFGGLREVTDLKQAIARLGFKQVGNIVTALLLKGNLTDGPKSKSDLLEALWNHSVSVAFCSKELADRAGVDGEQAFLAGLLHDCGRLAVLKAVDHILESNRALEITEPVLQELMDSMHCEMGHATLTSWKLPEAICEVALRHEHPCDDDTPPLMQCIQAANAVAQKIGLHIEPDPELDLTHEPPIEMLGISDIELAALMVDLEDKLEETVSQFGRTS